MGFGCRVNGFGFRVQVPGSNVPPEDIEAIALGLGGLGTGALTSAPEHQGVVEPAVKA